jgi:hypothetical protein
VFEARSKCLQNAEITATQHGNLVFVMELCPKLSPRPKNDSERRVFRFFTICANDQALSLQSYSILGTQLADSRYVRRDSRNVYSAYGLVTVNVTSALPTLYTTSLLCKLVVYHAPNLKVPHHYAKMGRLRFWTPTIRAKPKKVDLGGFGHGCLRLHLVIFDQASRGQRRWVSISSHGHGRLSRGEPRLTVRSSCAGPKAIFRARASQPGWP